MQVFAANKLSFEPTTQFKAAFICKINSRVNVDLPKLFKQKRYYSEPTFTEKQTFTLVDKISR